MMLPAKYLTWLAVPFFLLAAFVLYSNTFENAFHFDDFVFIVNNPELTNVFDLKTIWNEGSAPTRFITYVTFAVNYHFHRYELFGYHAVNILIHGCNVILVYWMTGLIGARLVVQGRMKAERVFPLAMTAAAVFLCHPLQTQAVTYLCQRFASLATFFYLVAMVCYLRGRMSVTRQTRWWAAALFAAVTGMFTKQIVLTLPLMILLTEWYFFGDSRRDREGLRPRWPLVAVLLTLLLVIPGVYSFDVRNIVLRSFESWSHRGDTLNAWTYFLTQSRVIWTYIRLLLFPAGQNLLYDFTASYHIWEPKVMAGFLGIAVLIGLAVRYRREYPVPAFGILWFFTALLVESSIIPIRHVIFEHRLYLPMFGFSLTAAYVLTAPRRGRWITWVLCCITVMTLAVLTYRRNAVWRDGVTLWSDVVKKSPHKIRPYTHLATAYMNQADFARALDTYTRAISVDPDRAESYNNRGNVYTVLKRYDLALQDYEHALALDPTLEKTYNNVGIIYNKRKQFGKALENYNQSLTLNPSNAAAYFNRANVYLQKNELKKAFADYSQSIQHDPFQKKAYYYRSQIYATGGDYHNALQDILEVQTLGVKVDPAYIEDLRRRLNP